MAASDNFYPSVYDREIADRIKYAQEQEANNLRYYSKIQQLEKERL